MRPLLFQAPFSFQLFETKSFVRKFVGTMQAVSHLFSPLIL